MLRVKNQPSNRDRSGRQAGKCAAPNVLPRRGAEAEHKQKGGITSDSAIYDYRDPSCRAYLRAIKVTDGSGRCVPAPPIPGRDGAVVGDAGNPRRSGGRRGRIARGRGGGWMLCSAVQGTRTAALLIGAAASSDLWPVCLPVRLGGGWLAPTPTQLSLAADVAATPLLCPGLVGTRLAP